MMPENSFGSAAAIGGHGDVLARAGIGGRAATRAWITDSCHERGAIVCDR